jgi:hypothetical protein
MAVSFSAEAEAIKVAALAVGALVGKVTNAAEQAEAVTAQMEIQKVLAVAEKARKACKAPVLEFGKKIDAAAERFTDDLKTEMTRIAVMVGSFQQLEQMKVRAAEQARNAELSRLEREKAEALTKATSHDAADAIAAHYNRQAESVPVYEAARTEGQRVVADWDISVSNPYELAKFHPACVKITPLLGEIKALLRQGISVKGIVATPVVRAGVRVGSAPPAIDV